MIYLGIDISLKSIGWAIISLDGDDETIVKTGLIKNPEDQATGSHLTRISDHIGYLISNYNIDNVIIEDLFIKFVQVGKSLFQIHGVVKDIVYRKLKLEAIAYHQGTWRKALGIKRLNKAERDALLSEARNKTDHKYLCDIKHRVIAYVNDRLKTEYTYEENDIADAVGLILAHKDMK